ncbi:MAG: SBBP repeat-containing protein [Burkholderiales bacterium]
MVLSYSTFLGGSDFDGAGGIAVDAEGNAFVAGSTRSFDFPTTAGAFQPTGGGGVFVTKLGPTGSSLVYSTYLLGGSDLFGLGIAVDADGSAYVTGSAGPNFPTTPGAFQPTSGGGDAFVAKLNPTGSALIYSTYLGGAGSDGGSGIAVDPAGNAYVTGDTYSTNFPTTAGALQTILGGGDSSGGFPPSDTFVTKLDPAGSGLVYSRISAAATLTVPRESPWSLAMPT